MNEKKKICKQCHKPLHATTQFFNIRRVVGGKVYLHAVCKMCESKKRHSQDIWKRKAQRTIAYHRLRALEQYQIAPERFPSWDGRYETFATTYEWFIEKIAREMEAAFGGVCKICGEPYKSMGHGRGDMTVDIMNHTLEPFYADNTRIVCLTCNSGKGAKTLDEERQRKKAYKIWSEISPESYQLPFSLLVELPTGLPDEPVEAKIAPPKEKLAIYEASEQLKLFQGEDI